MKIDVVELQICTKYSIEISSENFDGYIYGAKTAAEIFSSELGSSNVERIGVLFLDNTYRVINYSNIAIGSVKDVKMPIAELFKLALLSNASRIFIAHNHPSGVLEITEPDIELTKKIGSIAKLFDMELMDSIIVSFNGEAVSIREHLKELV